MRENRTTFLRAAALLVGIVACSTLLAEGMKDWELMKFAAQMARDGNWREANYRWTRIEPRDPANPRLLNNLAVSLEALGRFDEAGPYYRKALELSDGEPRIQDNQRRYALSRRLALAANEQQGAPATADAASATEYSSKAKKRGRVLQVNVDLPVPPRLKLEGQQSLLVASFLTEESALLDTNRELVRFLRSEFRKKSGLDVLPVVPPPAVPEQSVDDLLANAEFWKYLSREHDADIIVSGVIDFKREDSSGFRDVDVVSRQTGQKVRQTQFVDQEKFRYSVDLFFIEGATGKLLFRDTLRRSVLFRGQSNDPITAFYELCESVAGDVLAVVSSSKRADTRFIFKL